MPKFTAMRLTLAGLLTLLAFPILYWIQEARKDRDTMLALVSFSAIISIVGLGIWCLAAYDVPLPGPSPMRFTHVNLRGDTVLSIPSVLASLLLQPEYAPLVEMQARNGGIPVPMPPDLFALVLQLNRDFTSQKGENVIMGQFMSAVFLSTHQVQDADASAAARCGAEKC